MVTGTPVSLANFLLSLPLAEFPVDTPDPSADAPRALSPSALPKPGLSDRGTRNNSSWHTMASTSFRDSINSLGWSRRNADIPVNTAPQGGFLSSLQSLNPFGDRGYVQLPTTEGPGAPLPAPSRREEEEGWFACESARFPCRLPPRPISLFSFLPKDLVTPADGPAMQDMCRACMAMSQPAPLGQFDCDVSIIIISHLSVPS